MKILNFGSCNIDHVYKLDHIVVGGETADSESLERFPGGKGLNQSVAIARSGAEVFHAGCIGHDGMFLKEILDDAGANTKYLKIEDASTGHAIIQVDKHGENSIILYHGTNHMIDEDYIDSVFANFSKGDILLLQNEISNLDYIISKGYQKGFKIILNPSPITSAIARIDLSKIYMLILNEIEAFEITGEKEPEKIQEYFVKKSKNLKAVLTLGSKGSVYMGADSFTYHPAFKVDAIDTTAAGDTFTGYFISGMIQDMKITDILKYATGASALTVSRMGAASSIPVMDDVKEALKTLKPASNNDSKISVKKN